MAVVSIVMPAFNAERTIYESIESVINQTYKDYELIVVLDCPTDGTPDIVAYFSKQDDRIHVLSNKENKGVSYSRNRGVNFASGKYIAFLDSDDVWEKNKLEIQLRMMIDSGYRFSYTSSAFMNSDGEKYKYVMIAKANTSYNTILTKNLISCSSVIIDSDIMKNIQMPDDNMHEDYYTWLTVLMKEKVAYGVQEPLLIYRLSKNSKSGNRRKSAEMLYRTYRAVGYSSVSSVLLTFVYSFHSVSKRIKIRLLK